MPPPVRQRRARSDRGFTLIEIGVVLALVLMLAGMAIPAVSSISGATARSSVGQLAAALRATRAHAASVGHTCRVVFDLEKSGYFVECARGMVRAQAEKARNGRLEDEKPLDELSDEERQQREILKTPAFQPEPDFPPRELEGGIAFESVWTGHQEEPYTEGRAYLYFYPSGLSERAHVLLQRDEDWYTLKMSPLAGRVKILAEKVELRDRDDLEADE